MSYDQVQRLLLHNGFGNAIEYLGRYTHKVAISNSRIISVTDTHTTFTARGRKPGDPRRTITLSNEELSGASSVKKSALLNYSESDTFLMNYNMNNRYLIDKKGQIMIFSHYLTSLLVYRI